jgi:hypothetical protein
VLSLSAFEQELQARWASLKSALRRNDMRDALECLVIQSREQFMDDLTAPNSKLKQAFDPIPDTIRYQSHREGTATFLSAQTGRVWYEVTFEPGVDGVWRIWR